MQTLKGRTCVIAGGSGGDGAETVKELCRGGMNVAVLTHQASQAQTLVDEIAQAGYPGTCIALEGTSGPAEHDPKIMQQIVDRFGSIDVMIANTGADGHKDSIETIDVHEMMHEVEHLAGGGFAMMQTMLPYLKKSRVPRIIFMTTVEAVQGGTHESFVNAIAKGTVQAMMLNSASRLAAYGITVNSIAKGAVCRTVGHRDADAPSPYELQDRIPLGRVGMPIDLANAVCFLASEESSFVTGQTIYAAGGLQLG